jgi:multidrug transporter EmrE-like cation transporter
MTNTLVIWTGLLVMNTKVTKQSAREATAQRVLVGCGAFGAVVGATWAALDAMEIAVPRPLLAAVGTLGIPLLGWATVV